MALVRGLLSLLILGGSLFSLGSTYRKAIPAGDCKDLPSSIVKEIADYAPAAEKIAHEILEGKFKGVTHAR